MATTLLDRRVLVVAILAAFVAFLDGSIVNVALPAITAELARWNRSAVPFNLIYAPSKPEPVVLPELLTPGKVLAAFAEASSH